MKISNIVVFLFTVFLAHLTVWIQINSQFFDTKWKIPMWEWFSSVFPSRGYG